MYSNKFQKNEIVIIRRSPEDVDWVGMKGVISDVSYDENVQQWLYRVDLYDDTYGPLFLESDIETTGKSQPKNKFNFWEIVTLKECAHDIEFLGLEGVIRGMVYSEESDKWIYGISFPEQYIIEFDEHEIESTGKFVPQEEIDKEYDGSSLKVSSSGEVLDADIKNPTWTQKQGKPAIASENE